MDRHQQTKADAGPQTGTFLLEGCTDPRVPAVLDALSWGAVNKGRHLTVGQAPCIRD